MERLPEEVCDIIYSYIPITTLYNLNHSHIEKYYPYMISPPGVVPWRNGYPSTSNPKANSSSMKTWDSYFLNIIYPKYSFKYFATVV